MTKIVRGIEFVREKGMLCKESMESVEMLRLETKKK